MGYFPRIWVPPHAIFTKGELGFGAVDLSGALNSVAFTANRAQYVPIIVPAPVIAKRLFMVNGTVVSGNVDVGIYRHDGTKVVSAGSTAQAGTSTLQFFHIADTEIPAGNYYLAVVADNGTATFGSVVLMGGGFANKLTGAGFMGAAFPLPTTLTLSASVAVPPAIGIEIGRLV